LHRHWISKLGRCFTLLGLAFLVAGDSSNRIGATAKGKEAEPYSLLAGSSFNQKGFSLSGVTILVEMKVEPARKVKKRKWELVSSPRGEFAVRLPAGKNSFLVTATKKGYKPVEKTVDFTNDERQDIVLNMELVADQK
jgi:hypothetical protein